MNERVPRVSLAISILDDEDYVNLVKRNGGLAAFGVFNATLVVARERLARGELRRTSDGMGGVCDNCREFIASRAGVTTKQFDAAIKTFADVAKQTGRQPWMFINEMGKLVIRNYFKFNHSEGWGGPRPGAGRPATHNQVDSTRNQLDSNLESSRCASVSVSVIEEKTPCSPPNQEAEKQEAQEPIRDVRTPEQRALCEPGPETPTPDPPSSEPLAHLSGKCSPAEVEHLRGVVRDLKLNLELGWDIRVKNWGAFYPCADIVDAMQDAALKGAPPSYATEVLRTMARKRDEAERDRDKPKKPEPLPAYLQPQPPPLVYVPNPAQEKYNAEMRAKWRPIAAQKRAELEARRAKGARPSDPDDAPPFIPDVTPRERTG